MRINRQDRFKLCVVAIVGIGADVVTLITLGHIVPEWRAYILFSDWIDGGTE